MKAIHRALGIVAAASVAILGASLPTAPAFAAMPVFDATNYAQNILQAARALDQINNQVKSLQNQASMLQGMARNLQTVDFPQLQKIRSSMQRIEALMNEAQAIDFRVDGLDRQVKALFPGELRQALSSDGQIAQARARLDAAMASYRQAMTVQSQIAENVRDDAEVLSELSATSQGAEGALQVGQAANQLLALSVKQQLQLQSLMAAEFRGSALDRARQVQAAEEGRAATRRFLGEGRAGPK